MKSSAQRRLMYASAAGAKTGVPENAAKDFVAADKPGKLPERVGKAKKFYPNTKF